jgi:hypothetical protein
LLVLGVSAAASCNVNDYCLNCDKGDDGGTHGDGGNDGNGDGNTSDAGDAGACVPSGPEICDGKDNDCNGFVDDGVLPGVGDLCANQMGACAGGIQQCVNGALKCTKQPSPETCDGIDNDCNGLTDEGDPGGGGKCGTDQGECVAGTNHCVGGHIQCTGFVDHTGDPELCNMLDDDCDGSYDEGLTNMGPCGIKTCVGGTNKGTVCQTSGDCTGGGTCQSNVGACTQGTLSCQGGTPQCMPLNAPHFEMCDSIDNDCDGVVDEDFDLQHDINHCGDCLTTCTAPANAVATCAPDPMNMNKGTCGFACKAGYHDLDGNPANGCEYGPCFPSGVEVCDGADNDCDGLVDAADPDLGAAPPICPTQGACATGAAVQCDGAVGWRCHYSGDVSTDMTGTTILPETSCDNIDNDCNGIVDDHQANKNQPCDDGLKGECRSYGTYQCDAMNLNGPAICQYTHTGVAAQPESCDNLDNDCDGVVDNTLTPGTYPNPTSSGLEWINIGAGKQMMKYEASKPDATAATSGSVVTNQCGASSVISTISEASTTATITTAAAHNLAVGRVIVIAGANVAGYNGTFSVQTVPTATTFTITATAGLGSASGGTASPVCPTCSTSTRQPWTNVTYPQAVAACAAVGATLCTDQQWHRACSVVNPETYPINVNTGFTRIVEAENYFAIAPATDAANSTSHAWVEEYAIGYSGISAMQAQPDIGSDISTANSVTQGPRLDYVFNFQKAGTNSYHVYVLMYAVSNANRISVAFDNQAAVELQLNTTNAWTWRPSNASAVTFNLTQGQHTLHVYMERDGVRVDAVAVQDSNGAPALPANPRGNTWAYAATPNTYQPTTCNGHDYDATQDATLPTGSLASCYADDSTLTGGAITDHAFDMSGNVKEWTLAHQPGQNAIRGGASNSTDVGTSCALNFTLADDTFFFPNVGFRCCR